jgi:hypothetical protein
MTFNQLITLIDKPFQYFYSHKPESANCGTTTPVLAKVFLILDFERFFDFDLFLVRCPFQSYSYKGKSTNPLFSG